MESFTITPGRCIETVKLDFVLTLNLFMHVCLFFFCIVFFTQLCCIRTCQNQAVCFCVLQVSVSMIFKRGESVTRPGE